MSISARQATFSRLMRFGDFLTVLALVAAPTLFAAEAAPAPKPNILVILTDDKY
jgi:hypothetical protein